MKKIIAMAAAAVIMASSTFALGLSAGVRGDLGKTLSNDWADVKTELSSVNINTELDFGFGGYVNVEVLNGLGIQVEGNVIKNSFQFTGGTYDEATDTTKYTTKDYDVWMVDVPVMLWDNFDLGRLTLGLGAGVNFSFNLDATDRSSFETAYDKAKEVYTNKSYIMGACAGIDGKFFITDTIGIVGSVRYIGNFEKTTASYPIGGTDDEGHSDNSVEYPTVNFTRNSFYAGIGVEVRLF